MRRPTVCSFLLGLGSRAVTARCAQIRPEFFPPIFGPKENEPLDLEVRAPSHHASLPYAKLFAHETLELYL
eukprot:4344206-Pleurochrysis_carterae.AAC.1